ncbi:MFS transporter [Roseovarius sp. E0-M6]|uniref:MFS transporter n=1 Tax=Roseovarius sp. E0-M6 TaxID=3127118 RepID=UPI003010543A
MRAGLILLCLAYVLSQFFRAFLAVLGEALERDVGAGPGDLALASGLWFAVFAAMQPFVGWALDRVGPRRTASTLLLLGGGGGAALFAVAATPVHVSVAMALIGVGCSPVLMAAYYIIARQFGPAQFATLAAVMLGVGSLGNLVASWPMAWATETFGWRIALGGLSVISVACALGIWIVVRDPEKVTDGTRGSILDLLRMRALWPIFALMFVAYAPTAAIRGLWIGPYLSDVHGLSTVQIGQATLAMGVAMIAGTFIIGPLDRVFGTQKWVCFGANLACGLLCLILALSVGAGAGLSIVLCALIGLSGASFPVVIAHARSFISPALAGRGVTLMNLFGIGGAGLIQFGTAPLHVAVQADYSTQGAYAALFAFFGIIALTGTLIYLWSGDHAR